MKNKTQLLSCILIVALSCFFQIARAQWSPKTTGCSVSSQKGLFQMKAVDNKVAWAMTYLRDGGFGTPSTEFTRTVDGGKHWTGGSIPFEDQILIGLSTLSASSAYLISYSAVDLYGKILRTNDGGISWTELTDVPFPMFYQNI